MDAQQQSQLLPCPFCGCYLVQCLTEHGKHWIYCAGCGARGPRCETQDTAVSLWNAPPRQQAQADPSPTPAPGAPTPEELLKTILQAVPEDERQTVLDFARRLTTPAAQGNLCTALAEVISLIENALERYGLIQDSEAYSLPRSPSQADQYLQQAIDHLQRLQEDPSVTP